MPDMTNDAPQPPFNLARAIRDMKPGEYQFFDKSAPNSVRVSISRLKLAKEWQASDWTTRPKKKGCEVWRLK